MPESRDSNSSSESDAAESVSQDLVSRELVSEELVSEDSMRVLERGELLLERLAREAQAARAEARCAELEQVLMEARRRGDPEQLKRWLDHYDQIRGDIPTATVFPVPYEASYRAGGLGDAAAKGGAGAADRARVTTREHLSVSPEVVANTDSVVPSPHPKFTPAESTFSKPASTKAASAKLTSAKPETTKPDSKSDSKTTSKPATQVALCTTPLAAVASKVDPVQLKQQQEKQQQELEQQRRRAKLRGMAVSLVLHVLLLILLALLAIKLPEQPASLAFESSASEAIESFEMTESLEVTAPAEVSETVTIPETSIDLTDSLSDLSTSLASDLAEGLSAPATSSATAAVAALAAGSVNPAAMKAASSFFGADASGNNFCYVIDSSGSMRGGAWEAAKAELLRSLLTLKESQRFYVIFFNAELDAIPLQGESQPAPNALYATPENIEHAQRWIETVRIETGASPMRALETAVELEPDAIYLLTDGVTSVDVPNKVRAFNRSTDVIYGEQVKVPIHAIAYYSLKGEQLMRQLAAENNGQFIYVPDPRKPANR